MKMPPRIRKLAKRLYREELGYRILDAIHRVLIIGAGLIIVAVCLTLITSDPAQLDAQFKPESIYAAFVAVYVVCDLVRLRFLRGATISLGFPVAFVTLLASDSPLTALCVVVVGSFVSETLRSKVFSRQRLLLSTTLRRACFYAGHHAVAGLAALKAYEFFRDAGRFLDVINLQATLAYVVVYALFSMLLVWPHDRRIRLFLAPNEEPFVRVDLLTTSMLLPFPASVFYLYNLELDQNVKVFIVAGVLPPLFVLLFYLSRHFTKIDQEREQLALREEISVLLGSPANVAEIVERILEIAGRLVEYRWGAIYSAVNGELRLCGVKSHKELVILCASSGDEKTGTSSGPISLDEHQVMWPSQIKPDEGVLGELAKKAPQSQFFYDGLEPSTSMDPYLPKKTALTAFPILSGTANTQERAEVSAHLIGLIVLARPKRLFTTLDWERGQSLSSRTGSLLLGVQRLEATLQKLYHQVQEYSRDPEKVRQAMRELTEKNVDVSKILAIISKRAFYDNLRSVLRGVVEGQRGNHISLTTEALADIYNQARDETPGMPPLNPHILQLLRTFTSSLSLAFSFGYQFPDVKRGPAFREFYKFLLVALQANTVARILSLDTDIVFTVQAIQNLRPSSLETHSFPSEVLEEVAGLQDIVTQLKTYASSKDSTSHKTALSQALDLLLKCELSAKERLRDPERFVFLQILSGWRGAITNELENLGRGPARLKVRLRSQWALPLEETTVGLVLENRGAGVASNVVIRLEPAQGYQRLKDTVDLGTLVAGKVAEPEFTLRPEGQGPLRLQFRIGYNDPERKGKIDEFADLLHLHKPPAHFRDVPNPYTPGLPLKPGNPTFVGRDDIFDFIQKNIPALMQKMVLVLVGERRTGKTSILRQLPARLNDPCYIPVFIDGQALGIDRGMKNFFLSLATAIADGLEGAGIAISPPTSADLGDSSQHFFEHSFLPAVRGQIGDRILLLTIDEFEQLGERVSRDRLPPEVFDCLRHFIQHTEQLAFIFAGTHQIEALMGDYWSVLFNLAVYKKVGFLQREETLHLITEPVRPFGMVYDDLAIEEILRLTACHPYFTQLLCNILVNHCNEMGCNYVTVQNVRDSVEELLETGRAHLQFLWQMSDWEARLALATLADLRERLSQVTAPAIADRLSSYQIRLNPGLIAKTMAQLVAREIVREMPGNPVSYDFTAQLYADWLRRHQSLSKIVEEVSVEPVAA